MAEEQHIQEQETAAIADTGLSAEKLDWRKLLDKISYKGIVNNVPFLAFIVLLCVGYIANNHEAIETQRELDRQQKLLKELHWRHMDVQSKLMNAGMEAAIIKRGAAIGIKPLMMPAYTITDTNKHRN